MMEVAATCPPDRAVASSLARSQALRSRSADNQTSLFAARDASASMKLTYDIEVWLPSIGIYKKVSSTSWAGDYQARRANVRYRPEKGKPTAYVHTLNASGLATSRPLPAIVEQNQQPDGSVIVPEPLRTWLGTDVLSPQR